MEIVRMPKEKHGAGKISWTAAWKMNEFSEQKRANVCPIDGKTFCQRLIASTVDVIEKEPEDGPNVVAVGEKSLPVFETVAMHLDRKSKEGEKGKQFVDTICEVVKGKLFKTCGSCVATLRATRKGQGELGFLGRKPRPVM